MINCDLVSEEKYKKLIHHEEYLRIIVESSLDGITVEDDQGRFEFANDSFLKIIEWSKEEIIGNYFLKIIPEEVNHPRLETGGMSCEGFGKLVDKEA